MPETRRHRSCSTSLVSVLALAMFLAGCGDSTGLRPPRAAFRIIERPRSTDGDTVDTRLEGELVLMLHDSTGRPRADTDVILRGIAPAGVEFHTPVLRFRNSNDPQGGWSDSFGGIGLRTDAQGTARAEVALGEVAGTIQLEIIGTSPAYGTTPGFFAVDTTSFMVHPGAPAALELLPRDSAVYAGRSYQLRMSVFDRYRNLRHGEKPATSTATDAITVTPAGLLTGVNIGRGVVRATLGNVVDSALVSVAPRGLVAATRPSFMGRGPQLLQFELDGSGFQVLADRRIESPSWSPTGSLLTFVDFGGPGESFYGGRLITRDAAGIERRIFHGQVETDYVYAPRFTPDESSVYFAGMTFWGSIMRVRREGGTPETVVARKPDSYTGLHSPSPSPDGRYLAYVAYANCCDVNGLRILDFSTGTTVQGPYLWNPRWLPGGSILGYRDIGVKALVEVNPDGTIVRETPFMLNGASPFDLSPDGQWVLMSTDVKAFGPRMLLLHELATGLTLPLAFSIDFGMPAWKP